MFRRNPSTSHRRFGLLIATLTLALAWSARSGAHDHHHKTEPDTLQISARPIPDVRLSDESGHQVRFASEVLRQRPALISFIYTRCTTTCPLVGATVATVTEKLQADAE